MQRMSDELRKMTIDFLKEMDDLSTSEKEEKMNEIRQKIKKAHASEGKCKHDHDNDNDNDDGTEDVSKSFDSLSNIRNDLEKASYIMANILNSSVNADWKKISTTIELLIAEAIVTAHYGKSGFTDESFKKLDEGLELARDFAKDIVRQIKKFNKEGK